MAVLDGGWQAWEREGRPTTTEAPNHPPGRFTPRPRPELVADKAAVQAAMEDADACIINALAPDVHAGTTHVHYGPRGQHSRPGRIPDSVNVWAQELIDPETNRFLPLPELEARFASVGALARSGIVSY